MNVLRRAFPFLLASTFFCMLAVSGCDRGSPPKNLGKMAPDFSITSDGQTVRLSQFRGKVVLLNFWATWCAPCLDELPSLLELHKQMPHLVILAVSIDQDPVAYRNFLQEYHVNLLDVRDPSQRINHLYGTVLIPDSYVIDQTGHLRRKFVNAQNWTSPDIEQYLKSITAQH